MTDDTANKCSSDEHGDVVATGDSFNSNRIIKNGEEIKYGTDDDISEKAAKKTKLSNQDSAKDNISTAAGKQLGGNSLLLIDLSSIIQRHPNLLQDYAKFHQAYHSQNYSKTNKKRKKKFIDPKILDVRRTIQLCCRDNDLSLALATFYECMMGNYHDDGKECQMHDGADANDGENDATENEGMGRVYLEAQTLYNLLNLCEGSFGEREREGRVHVGTPKDGARKYETNCDHSADNGNKFNEESDKKTLGGANDAVSDAGKNVNTNNKDASCEENKEKFHPKSNQPSESKRSRPNHHSHPQPNILHRLHHANQIHTLLSLLNIPCIEPAFTALIRLASRVGDWEKAEAYLDEAEQTDQCKPKLRMYSSLLKGYCEGLEVDVDEDGKHVDTGNVHDSVDAKKMERVPSQEGLIKALLIWKRMYEKSGGPSTGHPQFHDIAKKSAPGQDKNSVSNACRDEGHSETVIKNENDDNDISNAALFGEGIAPKITLTECEYSSILECATALHDVPVAERVLSDLMERVLIPGLSTTETILNWFRSETKRNGDGMVISSSLSSALEHVNLPPREGRSIGQVTNTNGKGWVIYHGCTIDCKSGALALGRKEYDIFNDNNQNDVVDKDVESGKFRLKPVELSNEEWEAMRHMNRSIVLEGQVEGHVSQFQGGGKGRKRPRGANDGKAYNSNGKNSKGNDYNKSDAILNDRKAQPNRLPKDHSWRVNEWKKFETFIKNHPPFNVVIDGANVGYFQQNFGGAPKHVDYRQIDWLVRHLLEQPSSENYHIMLFLHERHFSPKLLPRWAYSIIDTWEGNCAPYDRLTLCRTPGGMNDDWFWMQAALLRGGQKDSPSVLAITNDEMRDHHFQMLAQGSFLRWKERHQVHFDFGQYDKFLRRRIVLLKYPKSYSRRIQRLEGKNGSGDAIAIPLPKKGDEGRYVDGVHVADDGAPEEETYVLIRLAE